MAGSSIPPSTSNLAGWMDEAAKGLAAGAFLDVLVHEDRVSIRVGDHEAPRTRRRLVGLEKEGHAVGLQPALELPHVGEALVRLGVLVPSRVERQGVSLEHALEQP